MARHIRRAVFALASLALTAGCYGQPPTFVELARLPGGTYSVPNGVSGDGSVVVGTADDEFGNERAFRWTAGVIQALPSSGLSRALGVSRDGQVVVGSIGTYDEAVRWTPAGGIQSLGALPGWSRGRALAASADGSVVTGYSGGGNSWWAFRWTTLGGMQQLALPANCSGSTGYAINADGSVIVGHTANLGDYQTATRWAGSSGPVGLGHCGSARGVSRDGSMAFGNSSPCFSWGTWMRWGPSGAEALPSVAGTSATTAGGISGDALVAVGTGWTPFTAGSTRAVLWTPVLGTVDLNTYFPMLGINLDGWNLTEALGISDDASTVVGVGIIGGVQRGWVASGLPFREPGAGQPHVPPCYQAVPAPTGQQDKLVLITHGWNTTDGGNGDIGQIWVPFRNAIGAQVDPTWNVVLYNWACDSGDPYPLAAASGKDPWYALGRAHQHGNSLGLVIGQQGYQHVHFIAHSAGSGLITEAAARLKHFAQQHAQRVTIHTTYLDAYGGNYVWPGVGNLQNIYGASSDWSDHYFSREEAGSYWNCWFAQGQLPTGSASELELPNSYNLDVSRLDPEYGPICHSRHKWPPCFYRHTVDGIAGSCGSVNGSSLGFGFPLSYEKWNGGGGVDGWIATRTASTSEHRRGLVCRLPNLSAACRPPSTVLNIRRDPYVNFALVPSVPSTQAAVSTTPTTLTITAQPPDTSMPSPAWINFVTTTTAPVNVVSFDLTFSPTPGAAGLVSLYVDGIERGSVHEPSAPSGRGTYSMPTVGDLAAGKHTIAFRLDPLGSVGSTVIIENVATGFGEILANCRPDFDRDSALAVQDVFDFLTAWFDGDSDTDFNAVNGLEVQDIFDFLNAWFAGC